VFLKKFFFFLSSMENKKYEKTENLYAKENEDIRTNFKFERQSSEAKTKEDQLGRNKDPQMKLIHRSFEILTSYQNDHKILKSNINEIENCVKQFFKTKITLGNNADFFYFDKKFLKVFESNYEKAKNAIEKIYKNFEINDKLASEILKPIISEPNKPNENFQQIYAKKNFPKKNLNEESKEPFQITFPRSNNFFAYKVMNQSILRHNIANKAKGTFAIAQGTFAIAPPAIIDDLITSNPTDEKQQRWEELLMNSAKSENISHLLFMKDFAKEYNKMAIKAKIFEIAKKLPYYRKIRGDGNCFYRALGFLFLEDLYRNMITQENKKTHKAIIFLGKLMNDKIKILKCTTDSNGEFFSNILNNVKAIKGILLRNLSILWKEKFEIDINFYKNQDEKVKFFTIIRRIAESLNKNHLFDLAIIVLMRSIIYDYIQENQNNKNFKDFLFSVEETLDTLKKYGLEAENLIIPISAYALNCIIIINVLHTSNTETRIFEEKYQSISISQEKASELNLFFRPGHYDTIYPAYYEDLINL